MRVIGLDVGSERTGVAVSDAEERIATPLGVLPARDLEGDMRILRGLCDEYEVGRVVMGIPKSMDGTEGPQAAVVRGVADRVGQRLGLEVDLWDERLSSAEASRAMRTAGVGAREQRGELDKVAATLMLQGYLDSRRTDSRRTDSGRTETGPTDTTEHEGEDEGEATE